MEVRLNGRLTPALLDTGSAINVLTYEFADFPTVRLARERQRKAHEVQGALESFRPRVLLKDLEHPKDIVQVQDSRSLFVGIWAKHLNL